MASVHKCPECDHVVSSENTTAGAFELPPTLNCERCAVEMEVVG